MAAVDVLMVELLRIAKSAESESVRLAAVNSALDRAGLSAKQLVSIDAKVAVWDETFTDGVVVVTDSLPVDPEDDAAIAASNADAIEAAPVLRALPSGHRGTDDPLEGVVVNRPPTGPARIPRRVVEALRETGYDI
jgi:hypothetical protein